MYLGKGRFSSFTQISRNYIGEVKLARGSVLLVKGRKRDRS